MVIAKISALFWTDSQSPISLGQHEEGQATLGLEKLDLTLHSKHACLIAQVKDLASVSKAVCNTNIFEKIGTKAASAPSLYSQDVQKHKKLFKRALP